MSAEAPLVVIVEDDVVLRRVVSRALSGAGMETASFDSVEAFWNAWDPSRPVGCVVADLRLPGDSGLSLQPEFSERGIGTPIVFMTGYGDVETAVHAMKGGAVDFLEKPFVEAQLLAAVNRAIESERNARRDRETRMAVDERVARLTPREKEVMDLLATDLSTKEVASRLEISPRTVEVHRQRILHKMEVESLAALVRFLLQPEA
ncbi:MAG: response regulator transcription factor [Myxococcota bacterium]